MHAMDKLQLQKNEIDLLVISVFPTRKATGELPALINI